MSVYWIEDELARQQAGEEASSHAGCHVAEFLRMLAVTASE